jgi:hypothetical protein
MSFKLFSEQEIHDTYNKHVLKPESYFNRFHPFPIELNTQDWKWEGKDFPRVPCILDFKEWVKKHQIDHIDQLLVTDALDPEIDFLNYINIDHVPYSEDKGDFHILNLKKEYDFILFSQTIEHLYNPFLSIWNLHHHLKPGGMMFTSMPTINIPHMVPFHFNGYTPIGLCMLMKSVGFKILELGYWGNNDYINKLFTNKSWPSYENLLVDGNIKHDKGSEVQTWILVQK